MPLRKALFPLVCALAAVASQSCVEYLPPQENPAPPRAPTTAVPEYVPPPPQPPPAQPTDYPAQYTESAPPPPPPPQPSPSTALDDLLAPIALYPDPLIAIILPASTAPGDISAASNYLVQYGDRSQIDNQPWDPSVRALAHYPTVVAWMASNMDWTQALGSAFSSDPNGVMDAVQRLRARARAAGTLVTTPQQEVMSDDGEIEIVPAQDNLIYVPVYDPEVVYSADPYYGYGGPFINFGEACPAGIWLSYSFDWRSHRVWAGDSERNGWRQPHTGVGHAPPGAHSWHPPTGARAPLPPARFRSENVPMPHPMPGAPNPPPDHYKRPVTNTAQPGPGQHNYQQPQERPRLNAPPPGQQAAPAQVTLPPTNHGESPPVQRYSAQPQAPVERQAPPSATRSQTHVAPVAPPRGMPQHESAPAQSSPSQDPKKQN